MDEVWAWLFFLWQYLRYVVWLCHAENIFCYLCWWLQFSIYWVVARYLLMAFIVAFSGSSFQYITPFTAHQIPSILFLGCKPGFGVGFGFCQNFSHLGFLLYLTEWHHYSSRVIKFLSLLLVRCSENDCWLLSTSVFVHIMT